MEATEGESFMQYMLLPENNYNNSIYRQDSIYNFLGYDVGVVDEYLLARPVLLAHAVVTPAEPVATTTIALGIPHELAGRDNCLMCHEAGTGASASPADHAGRTNDLCAAACHKPAG